MCFSFCSSSSSSGTALSINVQAPHCSTLEMWECVMQIYSRTNKTVKISCQGGHLFQVYHSLCNVTFLGYLLVLYVISIQQKNLVSGGAESWSQTRTKCGFRKSTAVGWKVISSVLFFPSLSSRTKNKVLNSWMNCPAYSGPTDLCQLIMWRRTCRSVGGEK